MLYSVWDLQTNDYLHSGRNSITREKAIDEALSFLLGSDDFDEDMEKQITTADSIRKEEFLNMYELQVHGHAIYKPYQ